MSAADSALKISRVRREFIATYKCCVCSKRVRVYDWLPTMILCAGCASREARNESQGAQHSPQGEDS